MAVPVGMWESRCLRFPSVEGNRSLVFHHAPFPQVYSAAVFTRQLRGPHLSTWPW